MSARPDPWYDLRSRLKAIEEQLRRQRNTSPFSGTGIHPNGHQGLDSDNFVHGVSGYSFQGDTGNAEFNDLTLRGGIVGNDALTNPVLPGSVWVTASNFTVSPSWNTVINYNAIVPPGVTSAEIHAQARVTAFYNNAGTGAGVDYLYGILYVAALNSDFYPLAVTDNGGSGTNHVFRTAVLTGLTPGASVNFQFQVSSSSVTWTAPSSPGNQAKLGASIRWYR